MSMTNNDGSGESPDHGYSHGDDNSLYGSRSLSRSPHTAGPSSTSTGVLRKLGQFLASHALESVSDTLGEFAKKHRPRITRTQPTRTESSGGTRTPSPFDNYTDTSSERRRQASTVEPRRGRTRRRPGSPEPDDTIVSGPDSPDGNSTTRDTSIETAETVDAVGSDESDWSDIGVSMPKETKNSGLSSVTSTSGRRRRLKKKNKVFRARTPHPSRGFTGTSLNASTRTTSKRNTQQRLKDWYSNYKGPTNSPEDPTNTSNVPSGGGRTSEVPQASTIPPGPPPGGSENSPSLLGRATEALRSVFTGNSTASGRREHTWEKMDGPFWKGYNETAMQMMQENASSSFGNQAYPGQGRSWLDPDDPFSGQNSAPYRDWSTANVLNSNLRQPNQMPNIGQQFYVPPSTAAGSQIPHIFGSQFRGI
ncbi:uncharacterized protein IL334_001657 [Kwoniella shivajii]|uniref:Uncharacterized protein n=1 Tax=Kwoniella shivajii TaxID=564305 RepID=A0ABZ1CT64_9TREE|nr:hypothetical protein IL334_001657 [Kwoniella shivajii]